jgi:hypothetical protein
MPLVTNATNAQVAAMRRPRRRAGVILALLIAASAGVTGAVMFESAIRPPAPLNKTLARHWMVTQQLERVKVAPAGDITNTTTVTDEQIAETGTTLTPEDLEPLKPPPPEHVARPPRGKPARRTPGKERQPAAAAPAKEPPTTPTPGEVELPGSKSRREDMYRRD